jgi:monofunctional biosynthetic peptidoglycan transglycosylase
MARRRRWRRRGGSGGRRWIGTGLLCLGLAAVLGPVLPILALRWIDPPTSAFMLERARGVQGAKRQLRYAWVDWERIAPSVKLAVVASEDQRFAAHAGFDVESIRDAVSERARGGRRRGASTISQQVAKNLFLWPEKSLPRKLLEAWLTAWIELCWPKQRILEVYLNVAQFGDAVFGVEAASRQFFAKPASALTPREAALLAAVLPNPRRLHADRPSEYVSSRADWILDQMRYFDGPAYLSAVAER